MIWLIKRVWSGYVKVLAGYAMMSWLYLFLLLLCYSFWCTKSATTIAGAFVVVVIVVATVVVAAAAAATAVVVVAAAAAAAAKPRKYMGHAMCDENNVVRQDYLRTIRRSMRLH